MVRLTADLISRSSTYFNPIREREIDLRGNKIAVIENLGATQDGFDSIDLSDNEISKLENFPQLTRLRSLLVNSNKVVKISTSLGESLPNLDTLILTNNKLTNLNDVDALAEIKSLRRLSLLDNPVTKKAQYRLYVIHRIPQVKLLDFRKIQEKERAAAARLFGNEKTGPIKSSTSNKDIEEDAKDAMDTSSSDNKQKDIKAAIAKAKTLQEVESLTRQLESGSVPK